MVSGVEQLRLTRPCLFASQTLDGGVCYFGDFARLLVNCDFDSLGTIESASLDYELLTASH